MKKNILILEDNLYTAEDMEEDIKYILSKNGFQQIDITVANSIDEANDKLKYIKEDELLCVVADLNMKTAGLAKELVKETQGSVLTGWVWIYSSFWKIEAFKKKPIIFYSAFINHLEKNSNYRKLKKEYNKLILINKNEYGIDKLCDSLIKLIKKRCN